MTTTVPLPAAIVEEHRKIMETARLVPDEHLADFVRRATNPAWAGLMVESGFVWDEKALHWRKADG